MRLPFKSEHFVPHPERAREGDPIAIADVPRQLEVLRALESHRGSEHEVPSAHAREIQHPLLGYPSGWRLRMRMPIPKSTWDPRRGARPEAALSSQGASCCLVSARAVDAEAILGM